MRILVPIKRVIDAYVSVRVKSDNTGVETANVKMSLNPFCEIAVEEAIQIRERGQAEEIVVVTVGSKACETTLRSALAMGADRAILIESDDDLEPLSIAKLLKHVVEQESPQLVITGKQSIDGDNNQTGQMLAALLNWSQGAFASEIRLDGEQVTLTREIDGGLETLSFNLPAVVTSDLRLNEPRYPALPTIMKARKKPLDVIAVADTGIDVSPRVTIQRVDTPPGRTAGVRVQSVAELVEKLKNEARVI